MELPVTTPAPNHAQAAAPVVLTHEKVRRRRSHHRRVSTLILLMCIVVAVLIVLLVPLLVGGATPSASAAAVPTVEDVQRTATSYTSVQKAADHLGFAPSLPAELPEGYTLQAVNVLDGTVLELTYSNGKQEVLYRTAPGSEDLSWDTTEYAFTVNEELDGVTRSYAGVAAQKLSVVVWAKGNDSYALVAPAGLSSEEMHLLAEHVY